MGQAGDKEFLGTDALFAGACSGANLSLAGVPPSPQKKICVSESHLEAAVFSSNNSPRASGWHDSCCVA